MIFKPLKKIDIIEMKLIIRLKANNLPIFIDA